MPINRQQNTSNSQPNTLNDFSFLVPALPKESKKSQMKLANNKDAEIIMNIWLNAKKCDETGYKIDNDTNINRRDIIRLKSKGFISEEGDTISFTERGQTVIAVMALGETNKISGDSRQKEYTEILASMQRTKKNGCKTPKYAINQSNNLRF